MVNSDPLASQSPLELNLKLPEVMPEPRKISPLARTKIGAEPTCYFGNRVQVVNEKMSRVRVVDHALTLTSPTLLHSGCKKPMYRSHAHVAPEHTENKSQISSGTTPNIR